MLENGDWDWDIWEERVGAEMVRSGFAAPLYGSNAAVKGILV